MLIISKTSLLYNKIMIKISNILGAMCLIFGIVLMFNQFCSSSKVKEQVRPIKKVSTTAKKVESRDKVILRNLNIRLKYHRLYASKFSKKEKSFIIKVLQKFSENYYGIDHKVILSYISKESQFKKIARGCNVRYKWIKIKGTKKKYKKIKYCKSYDYGIGQHNSKHWKKRWIAVRRLNKKLKI